MYPYPGGQKHTDPDPHYCLSSLKQGHGTLSGGLKDRMCAGDVLQGGGRARGSPVRLLQRRGEGQGGGGRGHHRLRPRSPTFFVQ